jgi:copper transport protein
VTPAASHAAAAGTIAVVADAAHVVAAAGWVGGLAATALALVLARERRWSLAAQAVPRFSLLATGATAALIAAGIASAYLEVRAWRGLWETGYGQLVLVKVALLAPLLVLGAFNQRVSVPGLRLELAAVRRRFVRAAAAELALFAAVLAVTAVLVERVPAKAFAASRGPFAAQTTVGPYELDVDVDPARPGPNAIHLYLLQASGRPGEAAEATVLASLPAAGVGPLRLHGAAAGPGHFVIPHAELPIAGDWTLRFEIRRGEFDQFETTLEVPIRKD